MGEWSVYKHTSPSGKIYIGITKQKPEYRWRDGKGYKNNIHFYNAIKKYGWDNFSHEVLFTSLTQDEAERIEKELVREYRCTDIRKGYNVAEGGHALSPESRKKIGDTRRARNIRPWNEGGHFSDEARAKMSRSRKGRPTHPWTDEQKERVRQSKLGAKNPNYGKPMDPELKARLIELKKKPVIQIVGDEEVYFDSARDAGLETGIISGNITRVCRGQRKTAGGFVWRYAE